MRRRPLSAKENGIRIVSDNLNLKASESTTRRGSSSTRTVFSENSVNVT